MITDAYIVGDDLVVYCRIPNDIYHELSVREVHRISLTHQAYATYVIKYNL